MWDYCGMARTAEGLTKAKGLLKQLREDFWKDVRVTGSADEMNVDLEKAGRVADFIELGELMVNDALQRNESCGGHFRVEFQDEGEAKRNDAEYAYVAAWEHKGVGQEAQLHKEALVFENIKLATRSYK
jgi:succinate dehydrogenase / fumarate reductase flavoprotein subunit